MKTACLALLGSLLALNAQLAAAGIVVTLANDPGQNGGQGINGLRCNNGQLQTTVNLLASININNIHAYQPMAEIGLPTINMAFTVAGKPAQVTVQNAFNVAASSAAGNVWTFTLQDDGPHPGGQLSLGACTAGAALPAVTASFSTTSFINGQGLPNGADGGPAVPAVSGVPTIVNGLPAGFVAAAAANTGNTAAAAKPSPSAAAAAKAAPTPSATPAAKAAANTGATAAAAAGTPPNQDGNCVLTYPNTKDPILSAAGLATPWTITAGCDQANGTPTFIQGTVFDPATGNLFVYNPLVINVGTKPAIVPTAPKLPAGAIVTLHFGTNGGSTTLADASNGAMLKTANCVNGGGADKSIFGQFAYCNAVAFFAAVNAAKTLNPPIPALGTDKTGMPCPTTRSFTIVDQDPSDNVITTYLLTGTNQVAQNTAANQAALKAAGKSFNVLANGSDNRLITIIDNLIGCKPYMAPDLADNNTPAASLALNEIMAANRQAAPAAKVPPNDPMVLLANGNVDATGAKVVAYRQGVNEQTGNPANLGTGTGYCKNLGNLAPPAYTAWAKAGLTVNAPPADPAVGVDMATFLGARFQAAWGLLNCQKLTGMPSPITCVDAKGAPAGNNPAAKCTTTAGFTIQSVDTMADADSQPGPAAASDQAASSTSGASLVSVSVAAGLLISSLSVATSFV